MADVTGTVTADIPKQSVELNQSQLSVSPTTTTQQDLTLSGQRRVNLIWESTQSFLSISVVLANMIVAVYDGLTPTCGLNTGRCHTDFPVVLSSALFLIIGFYFSRTNHAAIGGIGSKPTQIYEGR
jgi:hypothetical protein